ncbi:MAG: hypothetical protein ACRDEA_08745, partial [Microcystaceae cyanobacterium]
NARVKQANGEAEAIRVTGQAKAEAYRAGVIALGSQGYTALQLMQVIGERQVRVVPDVAVSGSGNGTGLVDGLLGMLVHNQITPTSGLSSIISVPESEATSEETTQLQKAAQKAAAELPETFTFKETVEGEF